MNVTSAPGRRVAVVAPVFNERERTLAFLDSLFGQEFRDFTAVVVDMGSDGTAAAVRRARPEVVVLEEGDVLWAAGTNAGVRWALGRGYEYVFTVNADVTFEKGCLARLVAFAAGHPRSLVGALVCYAGEPERVWYAGGEIAFWGDLPHRRGRLADFPGPRRPRWLTGMGTLVPALAFQEVGLYDAANFPHYVADADFSLRAGAMGYELWVLPEARLYADVASSWLGRRMKAPQLGHLGELLFDKSSPLNLRARYRFCRRHLSFGRLRFLFFCSVLVPRVWAAFLRKMGTDLFFGSERRGGS